MTPRNTWAERDLPVLQILVDRFEDGANLVEAREVADALDIDRPQANVSFRALANAGYLADLTETYEGASTSGITGRARREVGTWPTAESVMNELVAALASAEQHESDPERRDKVVAVRQALTGFLRDVAVGVLSNTLGVPR